MDSPEQTVASDTYDKPEHDRRTPHHIEGAGL